jgi:hypothetical protein
MQVNRRDGFLGLLFLARCVLTFAAMVAASAWVIAGCSSGTGSTSSASTGNSGGTGPGSGGTSSTSGWTGGGDGIWRRNAVYAEAVTFDPCKAHQPQSGQYHYHADPVCLRYEMGDNLTSTNSGSASATYTEAAGSLHHSPILGWSFDGYPVYGPYGYSTATNASSPVRRMVSSFSPRNITVRQTLPSWVTSFEGGSTTLTSSQYGPAVSATYPLGRYIEDYDYIAGSGDLDQYNGRFCVTPDFPGGTYAYFVTIDGSGSPAFPYYISAQYNGTVQGGTVSSATESTSTYATKNVVSGSSTVPTIVSWLTKYANTYAQVISESNVSAGPQTTWSGTSTPQYADTQQVRFSSNFVYVNAPGLASHIMGPWYLDAAKTQAFPGYPSNQSVLARFPLSPAQAATGTNASTGGGAQGLWVNGVAMFNMYDFFSWSNAQQQDVQ